MSRLVPAVLLFAALVLPTLAAAQERAAKVALVIGNSRYATVSHLPNPRNDAKDMAEALRRLGFNVTEGHDLGVSAMRRHLASFADEAADAEMAIVFFAGHGVEIDKRNYLIPVDATLRSDRRVRFEAIELDDVVATLNDVHGLRLILLDACRTNPFVPKMRVTSATRSIGRGLSGVEPSEGLLIGYAAKAGTVAEDGRQRNSPYTRALLAHLEEPGLEVQFLFRKVRDEVLKATAGKQEPHTYGSLPGKQIYLKARAPEPPPTAAVASVPTLAAPPRRYDAGKNTEFEALFWRSIERSEDPREFEAFIARFPSGTFAPLARIRLDRLTSAPPGNSAKSHQDTTARPSPANTPTPAAATPTVAPKAPPLPAAEKPAPSKANAPKETPQTKMAHAEPRKTIEDDAEDKRREIARLTQRELKRLGCYDGAIDGLWGPASRRALERFNSASRIRLHISDSAVAKRLRNYKGEGCARQCSQNEQLVSGKCMPAKRVAASTRAATSQDQPDNSTYAETRGKCRFRWSTKAKRDADVPAYMTLTANRACQRTVLGHSRDMYLGFRILRQGRHVQLAKVKKNVLIVRPEIDYRGADFAEIAMTFQTGLKKYEVRLQLNISVE